MAKMASQVAEQSKSRVRLVRQDGMKQLKTDAKTQSKDDIKRTEKLVMKNNNITSSMAALIQFYYRCKR